MILGMKIGAVTSSGAYQKADGIIERLFNPYLREQTPDMLCYTYPGMEKTLTPGRMRERIQAITNEMYHAVRTTTGEEVEAVILCLPANLPTRADLLYRAREEEEPLEEHLDGAELMEQAVKESGFEYIYTLPEAVAVGYAYENGSLQIGETALVYNLGGETFSASLLQKKEDGSLEIIAERIADFGGDELSQAVLTDTYELMEQDLNELGMGRRESAFESDVAWMHFDENIERVKRQLCRNGKANLMYKNLILEKMEVYTQERFDKVLIPFYQKTEALLNQLFTEEAHRTEEVKKIYLAGGSSQFPYIAEQLEEKFGIKPKMLMDPAAASAIGAVVYGENVLKLYSGV